MLSNIIESVIITDPKSKEFLAFGVGCKGLSKFNPSEDELSFVKTRLLPLIVERKSLLLQYHMRGFDSNIYYFSTVVFNFNIIFVILKDNFLAAQTALPKLYFEITQTKNNRSLDHFVENLKTKIFQTDLINCRNCEETCVPSFLITENDLRLSKENAVFMINNQSNQEI